MDTIQNAQRAIEKAVPQGFSWLGDHWLIIGICIFGIYAFLAFISEIGKRPR
jgi:hypothetical protein